MATFPPIYFLICTLSAVGSESSKSINKCASINFKEFKKNENVSFNIAFKMVHKTSHPGPGTK